METAPALTPPACRSPQSPATSGKATNGDMIKVVACRAGLVLLNQSFRRPHAECRYWPSPVIRPSPAPCLQRSRPPC